MDYIKTKYYYNAQNIDINSTYSKIYDVKKITYVPNNLIESIDSLSLPATAATKGVTEVLA